MRHVTAVETLTVWHHSGQLDVDVRLHNWDGTGSREFRLAIPLATSMAEIRYDVPMGVGVVGACEAAGLTVATSVAAFDWIDPSPSPSLGPVLQPILLASRRSNHPEGNWYAQAGDHTYRFSLIAHGSDARDGRADARAARRSLAAVYKEGSGQHTVRQARAPSASSVVCTNAPNVSITACMEAPTTGYDVLVRFYEWQGDKGTVVIEFAWLVAHAAVTDLAGRSAGRALHAEGHRVAIEVAGYAVETIVVAFDS